VGERVAWKHAETLCIGATNLYALVHHANTAPTTTMSFVANVRFYLDYIRDMPIDRMISCVTCISHRLTWVEKLELYEQDRGFTASEMDRIHTGNVPQVKFRAPGPFEAQAVPLRSL